MLEQGSEPRQCGIVTCEMQLSGLLIPQYTFLHGPFGPCRTNALVFFIGRNLWVDSSHPCVLSIAGSPLSAYHTQFRTVKYKTCVVASFPGGVSCAARSANRLVGLGRSLDPLASATRAALLGRW